MGIDPDVKVVLDAMQVEIDGLKELLEAPPKPVLPIKYTLTYPGDVTVNFVPEV